jgi:ribonuclease HII
MPSGKRANRTANLHYEAQCWAKGLRYVIGLDEVGRGTWAGPVVAGAVCLPPDHRGLREVLAGVRDSKTMTPRQRSRLAETIRSTATTYGIGLSSSAEIDEIGIVPATRLAMQRALEAVDCLPDYLLLDSIYWPDLTIPHQSIIKGDALSLSIASASVLAKIFRDDLMREYDLLYPGYGFGQHKGYGTPQHQAALRQHGPCPIHRRSFAPIRNLKITQTTLPGGLMP